MLATGAPSIEPGPPNMGPTREGVELTPTRVIETPEVTHVRYRVGGRSPLTEDERIERAVAADSGS